MEKKLTQAKLINKIITDDVKIHAETDPNSPRAAKTGANQQLPRIKI